MPIEPADTSALWLQDQHRSDDVFSSTASIFSFNILIIKGIIYLCTYKLNYYAGLVHYLLSYT